MLQLLTSRLKTAGWLIAFSTTLFYCFPSSSNVIAARGQVPLRIIGFLRGPARGDFLGTSVAPAGDVNKDGYADFLAGAGEYLSGYIIGGLKVYLYYGGPGITDTVPDLVFPYAGRTLVNLSDISGDSLPDYALWPGESLAVRVYYGGNPPDTVPDMIFNPERPQDIYSFLFGRQIASGDVDGTSGRDLLISNPVFPDIVRSNGKLYLFLNRGMEGIDTLADWVLLGGGRSQQRSGLGAGCIIVLDLNGDGLSDIVVSELGISSPGTAGRIHIFLGRRALPNVPDITFYSFYSPDWAFGSILSAVGDLNRDGYGDFATTRPSGFPIVYFGGPVLDTIPDLILDKRAEVLAPAGDINHDGYPDLLTGYPLGTNFLTGFAYVYFGGPNMDNKADVTINEADLPVPAPDFGQAIAGVGDINGDGIDDFIVGAEEGIADVDDRGQVWVFAGDSTLRPTAVTEIPSATPIRFSRLVQNYPNPFNPQTTIEYELKADEPLATRLIIYDILGRVVRTLVDEVQRTGRYRVTWDGKDDAGHEVASGVYFYQLKAGNYTEAKKVVLLK